MSNKSQQGSPDAAQADTTAPQGSAAPQGSPATRRGVLAGVSLAGLGAVITACSSGGSGSSGYGGGGSGSSGYGGGGSGSSGYGGGSGSSSSGAASGGSAGGSGSGGALASTSEIPVGGGKVFASDKVVVTQPEAGTFKGFSAVCTHMQCTVDQVANGTIDCPCHGSKFSAKDGSVVAGPAPSPLPAANVKVSGSKITLS